MELIELETKLKESVVKIQTIGTAYAKARALSWQLQELRKVVLAEQVRAQNPTLSYIERENFARTTPEYKTHLEGTKEAIGEELKLKAEYERWVAQTDVLRSMYSLEKQRMKEFQE